MKIYTKTGDKGTTALLGGARVPKSALRIEAYGTIDELNAYIGLLRDQEVNRKRVDFVYVIQNKHFSLGSLLAAQLERRMDYFHEVSEVDAGAIDSVIDD